MDAIRSFPEAPEIANGSSVMAIGLLRPGTSVPQAHGDLNTIAARLEREYPQSNKNRRFRVDSAQQFMIGDYSNQYVRMLFVASLFVLLIACANVANLYLRAHRDAAAGLATWVPARRATRVDPLAALREE